MTLFKTSILNFASIFIKVLTGLVLNKIMAIYIGPSGYALASQFQNGISFVTTFASGAINTGVTKYTAEYANKDNELQSLWRTAFIISFLSSLVISLVIFFYAPVLSTKYLKSEVFINIIRWFSITLFMFVANIILLAVLNGKKLMGKFVFINISGSFISLIFSGFMAWQYGLQGAFISFATNQSLVLFVTMFLLRKYSWLNLRMFVGIPKDNVFFSKLLKFSLMAIVSAFCVTYVQIIVRDYVAIKFGWNYAGYWDAVWRISSIYLMLVTVPLGVYYLPRLSEINDKRKIINEIFSGYKLLLPTVLVSAILIYVMRFFIIRLLFTDDFYPMSQLMGWQLLGDVMKLGSWLLSYIMLSKALTKTYIITEIFSSLVFYSLVHYFCEKNGFVGVTQAYFVTYIVYWLMMLVIIISYFRKK